MNRLNQIKIFRCSHCEYHTRHFLNLTNHYREIHEYQSKFSVVCGIDNCQHTYKFVSSFQSHILRKHPQFYESNVRVKKRAENTRQEQTDDQELLESDPTGTDGLDCAQLTPETCDELHQNFDFLKHFARFLLRLRESKKVPISACIEIAKELENILSQCESETRSGVEKFLLDNSLELSALTGFEDAFQSIHRARAACHSLSTERKQNTFFENKFNYIEPVEIKVGQDANGNPETLHYIPIEQTLKALLCHDDVLSHVVNNSQKQHFKLAEYCDGSAFKNHSLFSCNSPALQIQLYVDDFQISNPLGNRIKQYKIMAVYFILGNLPAKYRSKLYVIQLALLARAKLVKKYGLVEVLRCLIDDIKSLESKGISLDLPNGSQLTLHGTVSMVVADNLAAHEMSGMMESFVANRTCRFCTATRPMMQTCFDERQFNLRSPRSYDAAVLTVENDPTLATVYGIKSRSPLNGLQHYHVCWGIPSDVAHDIFEGFGVDFLQFCIRSWVEKGFFSLDILNETIDTFPYFASDKACRPVRMASELPKFRVKQTASQCWCLLRLLPIMLGHLVPEEDELWQLYMQLLDIIDIVCAPTVSIGTVEYLRMLISTFLVMYFDINNDANVKPKAHYLIHYPTQILRFGPLVHCWTLRFEGKHLYFKEIMNRSKNHRNVCKTMARRHQFLQAMYLANENFLDNESVETTKGSLFPIRLMLPVIQNVLLEIVGVDETVFQADCVKVDGVPYQTGCCVVIGFENDCYQFGRIENCLVIKGDAHLLVRKLHTEEFCKHYHAYHVSETEEYRIVSPVQLLSYHELGIYKVSEKFMVVLKFLVDKGVEL